MKNTIIAQALQSIAYYLTRRQKIKAVALFILLLIASILDVFGLASLVPVIMAASTPGMVTSNKYFAFFYNGLGFESEKMFLLFLIAAVFLFFLLKNAFTTWINYKQVQFTASIAVQIIDRQYIKYTNLPFWEFNNIGSANLINGVVNVPQWYIGAVVRPLFIFFSEIAIISVIIIGILVYQPILFIILATVLLPAALLTYSFLKKKSETLGNRQNEIRPYSTYILTNTFSGFVELKLANKISEFRKRFLENQAEFQALEARSYLFSLIPVKVIEMVAILGIVTIFAFVLLSGSSTSLIGIIGLFAAAAYRLMPSVNRVLTSVVSIKQCSIAITDLRRYSEYDSIPENNFADRHMVFEREITFEGISFSFPGADYPTIDNINISIKRGEKVGFIGTSGSGKTTLMNLLLRFYKEQKGSIKVDGVSLTDDNIASWYRIIGYVKQDTFLMQASIKDNIALGETEVDPVRLNYAIEKASLRSFVDSLPEGVETLIGERGSRLSGGQRQRIGIARALYKNAEVLILDEATSALDTNTEREVSEAIDKLSETDMTILIIAHRITTLRDCDRIYEMKKGRIIAERSYEEVLKEVL